MVYVSGGQILNSKSRWRLSFIPDIFWGIINFIVLFFQTMINPNMSKRGSAYTSDYRPPGSGPGGPPGGPRRRMGGFGGGGGAPSPPPMGGG
ncbi:selenoprotein K-like [Pomacea canaliculata]|uniref:selenoprotein K-like n=1 Tax=Pomacea canaliculata TaxID=400727 RepID=UPI000D734A8F|nr:selenoprotein K-like [Pomacea canaliculata]